ncbi:MAG TPA: hypothetical protein VE868_10320, partial [Balneolaceae bacterium]|nr:hypothetical protein [Balneolaceae bacterium]
MQVFLWFFSLIILYNNATFCAASPHHLKNKFVRASFSRSGLTNLYNRSIDKNFQFSRDDFSITINGKQISGRSLHLAAIQKRNHKLIYKFDNSGYTISLIYELKPSWHFISKQLKIKSKSDKPYRVNKISVIREKLNQPVASDYIPKAIHQNIGPKDFGAFLRFSDQTGMFALVQNPFLSVSRKGASFDISYQPKMKWNPANGAFSSDRGCMGTYRLTGEKVPVDMIPEWKWTQGKIDNSGKTEDKAEIQAFTNCVSKFIIDHHRKPINVNVGWTENDYQIDVSTKAGRDVYKRIIDQASNIGIHYIVYAPTNSKLATHKNTADTWGWGNVLWLGLGKKIRKGQWHPRTSPIPHSIRTMINYANQKNIKLLAYVYPDLPFKEDSSAIVKKNGWRYANLGDRSLQNWLIKNLTAFKKR